MRVSKPVRSKTAAKNETAAKNDAARKVASAKPRAAKTEGFNPSFGPGAIIVAIMGLVLIAVLIAGHDSSDPTAAYAQPSTVADSPADSAEPAEGNTPAAAPKKTATRTAKATPAASTATAEAPKAPEAPQPAPAATLSSTATVAGCLERADGGFRLKDTSGEDAPKARSWKSGFLKKGSAPLSVVDTGNALGLGSHVGQRVSVTGTIIDREMRAHSLRRVAASCK